MAFAPADNPRIAIAMIVENGGFGAAAAAPIARKAFDYYLLGKLPSGEEKEDEKIETEQDNSLPAEPNPFEMRPEGEQTTRPEISNLSKVARTNSQPRVKAAASSIQKALTQRLKSTRLATSRNKNA